MSDQNVYVDQATTRARQSSLKARQSNLADMKRWGAYSLIKVTPRGQMRTTVSNYVTLLQALSGKTPREMEDLLGLRVNQLSGGADLYRLARVPELDEFLPRGYTTLVDGLRLRPGLRQDMAGYRPGYGAFQVTLTGQISATRIASLGPNEVFEPGIHPSLKHLYPAAHR